MRQNGNQIKNDSWDSNCIYFISYNQLEEFIIAVYCCRRRWQ